MGATFIQPCASCGCEPLEYQSALCPGLVCTSGTCKVQPRVFAATQDALVTLWNLSQQPMRPAVVTVNIDASETLQKIRDILSGRDDGASERGVR